MPTLNWIGKEKVINHHMDVPYRVLEKKYSYGVDSQTTEDDHSENMVIHGDNLEALKSLMPRYEGKIRCIYIDPPYNTGNENWIYNDNVNDPKMKKWLGEVVGKEGEDLSRHDKWLCMMYPRLRLLQKLLAEDGAIFISIDNSESANLKLMCDEIFGYQNFVANVIWEKKFSPQNDAKWLSDSHDHILVYAKNKEEWHPRLLTRTEEMDSRYSNPDNDPRGPWNSATYTCNKSRSQRPNLYYPIQNPFTGEAVYPKETAVWAYSQEQCRDHVKNNMLYWGIEGKAQYPRFKKFLSAHQGVVTRTLWHYDDVNHTQGATMELSKLGLPYFPTPKPTALIQKMLRITTNKDSIILDFFSGSATTAHAVMQLNAEDSGHRKFIMVQLPEPCDEKSEAYKAGFSNICEIGKERVRRAAKKIATENPDKPFDGGFRVFKLDETNMTDVYYSAGEYNQNMLSQLESNIKPDRTDLDLLFGCLLDWGLPLSMPYTSEKIEDCTVHTYNNGDLIACFDENIPDTVIKEIAKRQPLRAVFRDSSFLNSPAKINVGEIFKMLAPNTRVKVL